MTPALEARHLYRFFHFDDEEVIALRGVSLTVEAGETVAVVGPSGSGKSTLLACLAGLDEPDGGTVYLAGERLSRSSELNRARIRGTRIGMVFQSFNLLEHLSLVGNVALAQQLANGRARRGRRSRRATRRPEEILAEVGIDRLARRRPSQISGGELTRCGLAVALANEPDVILADEPTGELDSGTETQIVRLLRRAANDGRAVVIVTHSPAVADASDRTVSLSDGAMVD